MRTLLLLSLLAVTVIAPQVPICKCEYVWQNGAIVIVCCKGR